MKQCALYKDALTKTFAKLLSYSKKDSESLAGSIVKRYGFIENAMCADIQELGDLYGSDTAHFIKLCASIISRRVTDNFTFGAPHGEEEIAEYFKGVFFGSSVEMVYAMFYDKRGRALSCERVGVGIVNASEIITRRIVECALRERAVFVDIAHNHPRGEARPSREDVNMTTMLSGLLASAGIELLGHYIIAGQRHVRLYPAMDFSVFDIK